MERSRYEVRVPVEPVDRVYLRYVVADHFCNAGSQDEISFKILSKDACRVKATPRELEHIPLKMTMTLRIEAGGEAYG